MSALQPGPEFNLARTHGILRRPEHQVIARSDGLGWSGLYASFQQEQPYEGEFAAVEDHLLVLHLNGPVGIRWRLPGTVRERHVAPGGLFMLPGGMDLGVRLAAPLETLHIYLGHRLVREVAGDLGMDSAELRPCLGEPDPLVERLALGVRDALTDRDGAAHVYADYLSRALAARLLREHSSIGRRATPFSATEATVGSLTPAQLRRATEFMETCLERSITLADIAASCGLSPTVFARRFKQSTGMPPHQHLVQLRVERAKRLLEGGLPIVEVALACGFAHQEHLTGTFRRFTGSTPAAFRRSARR